MDTKEIESSRGPLSSHGKRPEGLQPDGARRLPDGGGDRLDAGESLDSLVDRVVESHRTVIATLEEDVRSLRQDPPGGTGIGELGTARLTRVSEEEALQHHVASLRQQRRQRAQAAANLRPVERPVRLEPPLVTRGGVLYVPPAFEAAQGLDEDAAHRLLRSGIRRVEAFLEAPDEELVGITGRGLNEVRRAKRDLDLMRLPHVDQKAADLLRVVGVGTVSRLSVMDPALVVRDLQGLKGRYRFLDLPVVLHSEGAVRRLVTAAQARSE